MCNIYSYVWSYQDIILFQTSVPFHRPALDDNYVLDFERKTIIRIEVIELR